MTMSTIIDKILKKYEHADIVVQMKARFFFFLCLIIIVMFPVVILYTVYLQVRNPVLNYHVDIAIILPEIITLLVFLIILALIIRGYFAVSAHVILILLLAAVWTIMLNDRTFIVSRLDTIAYIFCIISLTPLAVIRNGTAIVIYGGVNLLMLFVFTFFFGEQFNIPPNSLIDYSADNSIALLFLTITAFSIFSINRKSLNRAEKELAERLRAEEALQESEERFRMLFESSREAIIIMEAPSWSYVAVNKAAFQMFRVDTGETGSSIIGPWDFLPERQPDGELSRERMLKMLDKALSDGWCFFELIQKRFTNEEFPSTVLLSRCELPTKTLIQATMRDVTERKRSEELIRASLQEKEVLLKEIHHRVKNNFQIIISLINLQSGNIRDPDLLKLFTESTNRIRAMALVHEKLYQSENISKINFASYIKTIAEELYSYTITSVRPHLDIDAEDILLDIDQAIPCGLIVNELLTNALKYAFPKNDSANSITVSLHTAPAGSVTITVRDNGIGLPKEIDPRQISTLGFQLVTVLIDQISGAYRIERDGGTAWTITFSPARNLRSY